MKVSSSLALASAFATQGALGFDFPDCANGPLANNTVCDPKASPPDRAAALVKAMAISEKLENLINTSKGAKRLGLPAYEWWSEALHGVAFSPGVSFDFGGDEFSYATSFANSITLASAFDDDLVYKVASAISTEARAFANGGRAGLDYWTPNINPYKDPRWGRGHETPGEDPVRIKGYVKALLAGLEGDKATRKVIATCKHYAAYDLELWQGVSRHAFDAVVSLQDLSEYYLPPFQQCARDSKVGSFMCAYNRVNGVPACASTYLMDDILREHWGWTEHNNYMTTDCQAVRDFIPGYHNTTETRAEAAALAYNAGSDTVCEVAGSGPGTDVIGAYNQTLLSEEIIDRALLRLYEGLVRVGYFDPASEDPYRSIGWEAVNTAEAQELALQSAADGLVLLKNDGTLPLKNLGKDNKTTVALIGHWAGSNSRNKMLGGYSGIPPYTRSPVDAAERLGLTYQYASGPLAEGDTAEDTWTEDALEAARKSDIILYFGGTDTSMAAEDLDRESIAWPAAQLNLIETLAELGKPLVVAQLGDQVDDTALLSNDNVSAILWAGYPGQDGGTAVLNAITGASPPAGRLPVTQYAASYTDAVPMTDMALRPDEEGSGNPGRTYRWLPADQAVLPFGYGLHYASLSAQFSSSSFRGLAKNTTTTTADLLANCDAPHQDLCPFPFPVTVEVTNDDEDGGITSDYVALVFVSGDFGPRPYPVKTLVGYSRLRGVEPGETREADIEVKVGDLARADAQGNKVLYPGTYRFLLDVDSESKEGREVVFEVGGEEVVLEEFPQPKEE
ncbi:hypothetical protein VTI28DRAFT_2549 [Corynascus sepedonium]